jgi:hypothetical protein
MRYLKLILPFGFLLIMLMLASCKPAATPALSQPTAMPPSPLPTALQQQSMPETTREAPSSPVATPIPPVAAVAGIHIIAKIGPTCPGPERPGQVCEGPYEGEFVITTGEGTEAAHANTDKEGKATVDLPPGQYTIAPKVEGRLPSGAPVEVTVPSGQYVDVNLELDSGIR